MEVPLFLGPCLLPKAPRALCSRQNSLFSTQVSLLKLCITLSLPSEMVWTEALELSENRSADFPSPKRFCLPGFFKISERTLIRATLREPEPHSSWDNCLSEASCRREGEGYSPGLPIEGFLLRSAFFDSYSLPRWLLWFPSLR